jgi:hypothetical protein
MTDNPQTRDDLIIAAKTCYAEARGEIEQGQIGVLFVIKNRADFAARYKARTGHDHVLFGDGSAASACQAHNVTKQGVTVYQFTSWSPSDPNRARLDAMADTDSALAPFIDLATEVFAGDLVDPTNGADSYVRTDWIDRTYWAKTATPAKQRGAIGAHSFFRLYA